MKKRIIIFLCAALLIGLASALVSAQNEKIEVSTLKDMYALGENIDFKVSLLDGFAYILFNFLKIR
jgi:hypothetical protein